MNRAKLMNYIVMGFAITSLASIFYYYSIKPIIERRALNSNKKIIENALEFYRADFGVYPGSLDYLAGSKSKVILNKVPINLNKWEYSLDDGRYSLNSKL